MNIKDLKGIGNKTVEYLSKNNLNTITDLITYYPYRYQIESPTILENCEEDEIISINAKIMEISKVNYIKSNLNVLRMKAETSGIIIYISIFNRAYLKPHLEVGKEITVTGKYKSKNHTFTASNLKLSSLTETKIIPIYHKVKGLKNTTLEKIIQEALKNSEITDYIPISFQNKYQFPSKKTALNIIHHPENQSQIAEAQKRLIYEELFVFLFKITYLKNQKDSAQKMPKNFDLTKIKELISNLSFSLTNDQLASIKDGLKDMQSSKRMNRLLLGDVGSGKTIVATILMYANYLAGYQSAFMAPTEVLATQHFYSIYKLLKEYNIEVQILTGSMKKKEKDIIYERLSKGEIDILIGTHAILNDNLTFSHLGLIITDEQHRFGVKERNYLQTKGNNPDLLFMSATPIPRTYALTIYGDMDTSLIKEKPQGRKEIITKIKKEKELREVLYKVLEEIKLNHQIYVIAPMIEDNEDTNLKNVNLLKEKFLIAFHHKVPVEVMHGKLKSKEKETIMESFKNGHTKILISTTVIEVGVDVPLASTIIIFNAERFGLATLHQLRGRVGRNDFQSYCYLICNNDVLRLKVLEESNDGFYISEKDFEFRGEGDLFGERQSGDMTFKLANLKKDYELLLQVKKDIEEWDYLENEENNFIYQKIIQELKFNN